MERIDSRSGGPTASLPDRIKDVESLRHTNRKAHIMTFIRLVRHRLPIILLIIALLGFMYCAWSLHRTSFSVLMGDPRWPRPWPYPDQGLSTLNDWYDARNPPTTDSLKLHGEWNRVRATVSLVLVFCIWVLVISILRIGIPGWLRPRGCRT